MNFDSIRGALSSPGVSPPISSLKRGATETSLLEPGSGPFGAVFRDAVAQVNAFHEDASKKVEAFLSGENQDLHTTILATQRAELAFDLFLEVRSKVVQAYQEVMRQPL